MWSCLSALRATPTRADDLARYLDLPEPAPFVWALVEHDEDPWRLLAAAMRSPETGWAPTEPYPYRLATIDELRGNLPPSVATALYGAWCEWAARFRLDERAVIERWRDGGEQYRELVEIRAVYALPLQAAYGRPSMALTDAEVIHWALGAGIRHLIDERQPATGKLSRLKFYLTRSGGNADGGDGKS